MKMKILVFFLCVIFFVGCNSPADKSIFEKLSPKELSELMKEDSLYKESYEFIENINSTYFNKDADKAKFYDITYRRFHSFMKRSDKELKTLNDSCFHNKNGLSACLRHIDPHVDDYINFSDN